MFPKSLGASAGEGCLGFGNVGAVGFTHYLGLGSVVTLCLTSKLLRDLGNLYDQKAHPAPLLSRGSSQGCQLFGSLRQAEVQKRKPGEQGTVVLAQQGLSRSVSRGARSCTMQEETGELSAPELAGRKGVRQDKDTAT